MTVVASAQVVMVTSAAPKGSSYFNLDAASSYQFTSEGGQCTFAVSTNLTSYGVAVDDSWCGAKKTGKDVVLSVEPNTGREVRTTTLKISARDNNSRSVVVEQLGSAPAILGSTKEILLKDNATDFTVTVTSNTEVEVKTPEWISTSTQAGKGVTAYAFKATKLDEAGQQRSGEIEFTDKSGQASKFVVTVSQEFAGYPRFAVISDTHFGNNKGEGPMVKVPKALRNLLAKTPRIDAIFICGDLTDWGTPAQYEMFKKVFDDRSIVPADLPVYVMMGNHDNYADNALKNYLVLNQPYHRLVDIKGFPFITTSMDGGGWDDYAPEEVQALADNLKIAAEKYPGKPIFVFTHVPPMNTVYGTCDGEGGWGSNVLTETLKKYPQVVLFGGHSHFPLADPRSIHQGNFTTINDGSTTYSEIEPGVVNEGIHPDKYEYVTEGCIVDIDKDTNVEIQRWDTYGDVEILPRWTVKAPHDGSRFVYTSERTGGTAPTWDSSSAVKVSDVKDEGCTVTFPQAKDDENVHHYVVELVQDGEVVATHSIFSGYYLNNRMPSTLTVRMEGIPNGATLTPRVKALDSYKNTSEPLTGEVFTTKEYVPAPDAKMPKADLFDLKFDKDGKAADVSDNNVEVRTGSSTPTTYLNETYNRWTATFAGNNKSFYGIDYAGDAKIKDAFTNGFTFEVLYKPNSTDNMCPLSAQESGGAGIEQASGGQLQFFCYVDGGYKTIKSNVTTKAGKFYHVLAVYDKAASMTRLFVNGSPAGEMKVSGSFGFPSNEDAHWIAVGGDANGSGNSQFSLDGDVAVARMYSTAVSRDQAYLLYKDITEKGSQPGPDVEKPVAGLFDLQFATDGTASDISAHKATVKAGSTKPKVSENAELKRPVATFDGSNTCFYRVDYAEDEAIKKAFTDGFSFEVMYKTENLDNVCPMSAQESGGAGIEQAKGGLIQFYCRLGGGYKILKSDVTVKKGKFYHVVAVYDKKEGKLRMFVDGKTAGSMRVSGSFGFPSKKDAQWIAVGGDCNGSGNTQFRLTGDIAVARMYDKALSQEEAKLLYEDLQVK